MSAPRRARAADARAIVRCVLAGLVVLLASRIVSAQDTHLLVIVGVGGDEEHSKQFHKWATAVLDAGKKLGIPDANLTYLGESPDKDGGRVKARSTKENVTKAFTDLAARAKPNDEIFILLIGHGSFDGRQGVFNLPGPDLTVAEYAKLLEKFPSQKIAFVNTASSSGAFLEALKKSGELITTQALVDPSQAAVVSVRNGQPVVTDGPFLESKEYLGGFYLIDCENKERAIELAVQIPDSAIEGLGVEVRQVMFADGKLEA